jgi:hypothetical protein
VRPVGVGIMGYLALGRHVDAPGRSRLTVPSKCCVSTPADRLLVASGSKDKAVRVWDAAMGRRVGELLTGHRESEKHGAALVTDRLSAGGGQWQRRQNSAAVGRGVGMPYG